MLPRCLVVASFALFLAVACGGDKKPTTSAAVPDAANATYLIEGRTVTLSGGKADEPAAPGSSSRNATALTTFSAAGDLDGDGKSDSAVVLTNSPGGSGVFYYLAALLSSSVAPSAAVLIGDRVSISRLSIQSGVVTVSYLTRPDSAPFVATPSVSESRTFKVTDGHLTPN